MTKAELIQAVASETGETSKTVGKVLRGVLRNIKTADRITFVKFGSFRKAERNARECRNPRTGAPVLVPNRTVMTFKASKKG